MNNSYSLKTFPFLSTKRLLLRNILETDVSAILQLRSDDLVTKYIDRPKMKSEKEALNFILDRIKDNAKHKIFYWGITLKSNNKLIGTICLWNFSEDKKQAEIGYDLMPKYHHKGYMNEALNKVLEFAFKKIKLSSVEAYTSFKNKNSIYLLEKNKFKLQENRKDKGFPDNRIYTLNSN